MKTLLSHRIVRFLLVGFTTVGIDALIYFLLLTAGLTPLWSKGVSFIAGSVFSYLANWRFTFGTRRGKFSELLFAAVYLSSLTINVSGNQFLLSLFPAGTFTKLGVFVVITAITTIWNYIGMSIFVFKSSTTDTIGK